MLAYISSQLMPSTLKVAELTWSANALNKELFTYTKSFSAYYVLSSQSSTKGTGHDNLTHLSGSNGVNPLCAVIHS